MKSVPNPIDIYNETIEDELYGDAQCITDNRRRERINGMIEVRDSINVLIGKELKLLYNLNEQT